MQFRAVVGLGFAIVCAACAHTVGSLEVAARAKVDFRCDGSDLYVQTLARNHYAAAGCGQQAVFICQSGACQRDSEPAPLARDARVFADGHDARGRLNAVREAVLACVPEYQSTVTVEIAFAVNGTFQVGEGLVLGRYCIEDVLDQMRPASRTYEHPLYIEHVFGAEPWAPPAPPPAAAPTPPPPGTPSVEPVPTDPATTTAPPVP